MGILKKSIIGISTMLLSLFVTAQEEAKLQAAFKESYTQESVRNFTGAIATLAKLYDEKSYELNLRIGWLYYLNKDYPQSQSY